MVGKNLLRLRILILLLTSVAVNANAQKSPYKAMPRSKHSSVSADNQDCITAKPICTSAAFTDNSSGIGVNELNSNNAECFNYVGQPTTEHESSWYYFDIKVGGTLTFLITPKDTSNDYDFAVWGPHATCPINVPTLRCNSYGVPGDLASTGLSATAVNASEGPGTGNKFSKQLITNAGDRYILLVDNYSVSNSGFNISFGGTARLDCDIVQAKVEATKDEVCANGSTTLKIKSAQTYTWSTVADSLNTISISTEVTVNPTITTTYLVKGISDANLPYRITKVITVDPLPIVQASASASVICIGASSVLNAAGANIYQWALLQNPNNPISSNVSVTVTPTLTTSYVLTGTDGKGCVNKDTLPITVVPNPVVHITGKTVLCKGDSIQLTASGASTYTWSTTLSPAVFAGSTQVTVKPLSLTKYILSGIDNNGCADKDTFQVTVNPLPTVILSPNPSGICLHTNSSLSSHGGKTYKWYIKGSGAVQSTDSVYVVSPPKDTTYTVIATDAKGCTNSASADITVFSLPIITAATNAASICAGSSAYLTGSGGLDNGYTWFNAANPANPLASTRKYTVSPTNTSTYIVQGTNANNCKDTAMIKIYVNPLPNIQVTASDDSICPGITTRLDAKNGVSYLWYNATAPTIPISNTNPYIVNPTVTTTYNITGTDNLGCVNTSQKEVYVFNRPQTQAIKGSPYVCPTSQGVRYLVQGGISTSTYHWTVNGNAAIVASGQGNDTINVNFGLLDTIQMTVQETNKNGCLGDTIKYTVIIIDKYVPPVAIGNDTLCYNDKNSVVYTVPNSNNAFNYDWTVSGGTIIAGINTPTVTVKWNNTGTPAGYICYGEVSTTANPACRFDSDTLRVTIYPSPTAKKIDGDTSVCKGDRGVVYELKGMWSSSYTWKIKNGHITGSIHQSYVTVDWDDNTALIGTLKVLETTDKGCAGDTITQNIQINPLPQAGPITGTLIICPSNTTGQHYKTSSVITGSRFKWTILGGTIVSGNNTKEVIVDWNFASTILKLTVAEISKDSCTGPVVQLQVTRDDAAAQLLVVTTDETNDKEIDIEWIGNPKASSTINTYNLYKRDYGSAGAWLQVGNPNLVETNYADLAVSTHTKAYEYKYTTINLCNDVSISKPNNSMFLEGRGNESSKKVELTWTGYHNWSHNLLKYEIWRKLDDETDYTYYGTPVTVTDTTVTYTNGLDGFKHRYRIKSIEAITGRYAWSNDSIITFKHRVDVPNAYSPNGDGVNDTWEIKNIEAYPGTELEVFDRQGAKVFASNSYHNEWDGRSTGGKELPGGTYYYILKLGGKGAFGQDPYNGNITIVR